MSARALDPERGLWALCDIRFGWATSIRRRSSAKLAVSRARTSLSRQSADRTLSSIAGAACCGGPSEVAEQRRADVRSPIWRVSIHLTLPLIMDNLLLGQTAAAQRVVDRIKGELKPGDDPISGDIRIIDLYFQTYATPTANSEALLKETAGLTSAYNISDAKLVWVAELKGALYERAGQWQQALKEYRAAADALGLAVVSRSFAHGALSARARSAAGGGGQPATRSGAVAVEPRAASRACPGLAARRSPAGSSASGASGTAGLVCRRRQYELPKRARELAASLGPASP